jgi:hypothetical protein
VFPGDNFHTQLINKDPVQHPFYDDLNLFRITGTPAFATQVNICLFCSGSSISSTGPSTIADSYYGRISGITAVSPIITAQARSLALIASTSCLP